LQENAAAWVCAEKKVENLGNSPVKRGALPEEKVLKGWKKNGIQRNSY